MKRRKLDKNKIGFAIAFIITTALVIQKVVQAGTIFCLTTIYRQRLKDENIQMVYKINNVSIVNFRNKKYSNNTANII